MIRSERAFDGPNVWARVPVTRLTIEFSSSDQCDPEFVHRVREMLGTLCDPTSSAFPIASLSWPEHATPAAVFGAITIDLQRRAGFPVSYSATRAMPGGRLQEVVIQHEHADVASEACRLAVLVLERAFGGEIDPKAWNTAVDRFWWVSAPRRKVGIGQRVIDAARVRGIPVSRIDPSGRIVELGTGRYRRRFHDSITSLAPKLGERITHDKRLTSEFLRAAGIPVAESRTVRTVEQAVAAAESIGYPVVLKPNDGAASAGVHLHLADEHDIRARFPLTAGTTETGIVVVECQVAGRDYRVSVAGDEVLVYENRPPLLVGDGTQTVSALISGENADPRRGRSESFPLSPIVVDAQVTNDLARRGYDLESVPAPGERIELRPVGKIADGWISVDCTDEAHPENVALFRMAARLLDLDVVSIDVIAADIGRPLVETGGAIIEMNVGSVFRNELYPGEGAARDIGPLMLEAMFPAGALGRVPVVAVMGDDADDVSADIAEYFIGRGRVVGIANGDGVRVGGMRLRSGDWTNAAGARMVLDNPATEIAVVAVTGQKIIEEGLGFDACDLVVVTGISGLTRPNGEPVETVVSEVCVASGGVVAEGGDDWRTMIAHVRSD